MLINHEENDKLSTCPNLIPHFGPDNPLVPIFEYPPRKAWVDVRILLVWIPHGNPLEITPQKQTLQTFSMLEHMLYCISLYITSRTIAKTRLDCADRVKQSSNLESGKCYDCFFAATVLGEVHWICSMSIPLPSLTIGLESLHLMPPEICFNTKLFGQSISTIFSGSFLEKW